MDAPGYEIVVGGVLLLVRRDTAVNWQHKNPVLGDRELAYDTTFKAFKRGDGETPWRKLKWFATIANG